MYQVLIADDEILDLEGMVRFIPWDDLGIRIVDAVNNGFDALEIIKNQAIDILVTDVHMPGMSGIELARTALKVNKNLKLIFVSGYQDFRYVKEALTLHAYSYVLKPMDDTELISVLKQITSELDEQLLRTELDHKFSEAVIQTIEYRIMGGRINVTEQHPALSHINLDSEELFLISLLTCWLPIFLLKIKIWFKRKLPNLWSLYTDLTCCHSFIL